MLEIYNLVKVFGKFKAVDNLNLRINDGTIFGFVGPNGAGKTTTMKITAGLMDATLGQIIINGINAAGNRDILKDKIGYMPDFFGVYDNLKVSEYMDFYAGAYYIPYEEREDIINNLLELVDLTEKKDSYVDVLSRGMKQRLCLARSLVHDPDVLILDEPASGLDPRARVEMKEVLKQLKTLGKTIIISSHILPELAELCTEIGIINHGRIVAQGTVNDIMMNISSERVIIIKTMGQRDRLKILLSQIPNVRNITEKVDEVEFGFVGSDAEMQHIISEIVRNGIPLVSFSEKEGNLEDIFMKLTEERGNAV